MSISFEGSMANPPEREVSDLEFRQILQLRTGDVDDFTQRASSLVAVCNRYDLIFVGFNKGFHVLKASDLDARLPQGKQSARQSQKVVNDFNFFVTVTSESPPFHVSVSSDELTLSVVLLKHGFIFAELYDIRTFAHCNEVPRPFLNVKLSSGRDDTLVNFAWNPGSEFSSIFACCLSDGSVSLYELSGSSFRILASSNESAQATCICWSPKGKQIVVGKLSGELVQYDQLLKEKKVIAFPSDVYGGGIQCSVMDVLWESTQVFFAVYHPNDKDVKEQPWLVMLTVSKEGTSYVHHEDVCFGSDESNSIQKYYLQAITEWDLIICSSSTSLETCVLGRRVDNKDLWERWNLSDGGRPEIPLVDGKTHFPRGLGISFNSMQPVWINEALTVPASPYLLLLSTDGTLLCYHVIYQRPGVKSLIRTPNKLSAEGERTISGSSASKLNPPETRQSNNVPPKSHLQSVSAVSTMFVASPQVQPIDVSARGHTFGIAAHPEPQPSSESAAKIDLSSTWGQIGSRITTTSKQPVQQMSKFPSATGSMFSAIASVQSHVDSQNSAENLTTMTTCSAVAPVPRPVGLSAPSGISETPVGVPSTMSSSSANPSFLSASLKLGQPLSQSTPAPGNQVSMRAAKLPANPSASDGFSSSQKSVSQSVKKPGFGLTFHSETSIPGSGAEVILSAEPDLSAMSDRHDAAGAVHKKPLADEAEHTMWKLVIDEMNAFNKDLCQFRSRAAGVLVDIGTLQEMEKLRKGSSEEKRLSKAVVQSTRELKERLCEVKSQTLESWVLHSQCCGVKERNCDPKYEKFLHQRPLNPVCEKRLKTMRSTYQYVDSELEKMDANLDNEWEAYVKILKNKRLLETPTMHAIYDALKCNNQTILKQEQALESLCCRLKDLNILRPVNHLLAARQTNALANAINNGEQSVSTYQENKMANACNSKTFQAKEAKLRRILECRKTAPVVSCAPVNLSYSNIISAKGLQEMMQSDASGNDTSVKDSILKPDSKTKEHKLGVDGVHVDTSANAAPFSASSSGRIVKAAIRSSGQKENKSVAVVKDQTQMAKTCQTQSQHTMFESKVQGKETDVKGSPNMAKFFQGSQMEIKVDSVGHLNSPSIGGNVGMKSEQPKAISSLNTITAPLKSATEIKFTKDESQAEKLADSSKVPLMKMSNKLLDGSAATKKHDGYSGSDLNTRQLLASSVGSTQQSLNASEKRFGMQQTIAEGFSEQHPTMNHPESVGSGVSLALKSDNSKEIKDASVIVSAASSEKKPFSVPVPQFDQPARNSSKTVSMDNQMFAQTNVKNDFNSSGIVSAMTGQLTKTSGEKDPNIQIADYRLREINTVEKNLQPSNSSDAAPYQSSSNEICKKISQEYHQKPTTGETSDDRQLLNVTSALGLSTFPGNRNISSIPSDPNGGIDSLNTAVTSKPSITSISRDMTSSGKIQVSASDGISLSSASEIGQCDEASTIAISSTTASMGESQADSVVTDTIVSCTSETSLSGQLLFGQAQTTTCTGQTKISSGTGLFGQAPTTTSIGAGLFGQAPTTTSSGAGLFGQALTTTSSGAGLFGQVPTTTSSGAGLFGQALTTTSSGTGLFGQAQITTSSGTGLFGQALTTTSSGTSLFGQAQTTTSSGTGLFGQALTTTSSGTGLFGQAPTTTSSGTGLFGQAQTTTSSGTGLFGQALTTTSSGTGLFGQALTTTSSGTGLFGQAQTTTSSGTGLFGQALTTTSSGTGLFGQAMTTTSSGTGLFGQAQTTTSSGTGLFGQAQTTTSSGTGLFGQALTTTNGTGLFNQSQAKSSFGLFEQGSTGTQVTAQETTFGKSVFGASGLFGQQMVSTTAVTAFGQPSSSSLFGQVQNTSAGTLSSSSGFGFGSASAFNNFNLGSGSGTTTTSGGFSFGLGGKPDPEKIGINPFVSAGFGSSQQQTTGLFAQTSGSPFGSVKTESNITGAFSGGGNSIQTSGFGGFAKNPQSPTAGTFGSPTVFGSSPTVFGGAPAFGSPAFGGAPVFGSPTAFGSTTSTFGNPSGFGGGNAFSGSFGSGSGQTFGSGDTNSGGFANFAASNAPSFGSLAVQSDPQTFGSPVAQQSSGFSGFGGGGGTFGSGFGPGQNLPSTFTSYRK